MESIDLIQDDAQLNLFCKLIASEVLQEQILSEDKIQSAVKRAIMFNLESFIHSLLDASNSRKLKRRVQLMEYLQRGELTDREYKRLTRVLGKINLMAPIIKSADTKARILRRNRQSDLYEGLVHYLLRTGNEDLMKKFNKSITKTTITS